MSKGWPEGLHRRGDQASDGLCRKDIEGSQPATDLGRPRGAVGGAAGGSRGCTCSRISFSQPHKAHDLLTCSEKVRMLCCFTSIPFHHAGICIVGETPNCPALLLCRCSALSCQPCFLDCAISFLGRASSQFRRLYYTP